MNKILTANRKQYGLVNTRLLPLIDGANYVTQRIKAPLLWVLNGRHRWESSLLLNSMRKSGSHYFMAIITNYLSLSIDENSSQVTHKEIRNKYWAIHGNSAGNVSSNAQKVFNSCGCSSFVWTHEDWALKYRQPKYFFFLHRHPLDLLCSRYFYYHKNRDRVGLIKPDSPVGLAPIELPRIIRHYKQGIEQVARFGGLSVSYESIINDPHQTLKRVLEYLGIPYKKDLLSLALQYSSKKKLKEEEKKLGINIGSNEVTSSFARSGKIGEWKDIIPKNIQPNLLVILQKSGVYKDNCELL